MLLILPPNELKNIGQKAKFSIDRAIGVLTSYTERCRHLL